MNKMSKFKFFEEIFKISFETIEFIKNNLELIYIKEIEIPESIFKQIVFIDKDTKDMKHIKSTDNHSLSIQIFYKKMGESKELNKILFYIASCKVTFTKATVSFNYLGSYSFRYKENDMDSTNQMIKYILEDQNKRYIKSKNNIKSLEFYRTEFERIKNGNASEAI